MRRKDEFSKAKTCFNNAHSEEMIFVLLGRDSAAPAAIRAWVNERIKQGKNVKGDMQTEEALDCARTMEEEGRKWVDALDY